MTVDGYSWCAPIEVRADDYDSQGHLNNAAIARHLNDLRVAYIRACIGAMWGDWLREHAAVVAAREVHISYVSEGRPGEAFVGATRIRRRDGKAVIVEQRIVEATTGRVVADAWIVQLLVRGGAVVDWPPVYLERAAAAEGRPIPERDATPRQPFGPPPWPAEDGS